MLTTAPAARPEPTAAPVLARPTLLLRAEGGALLVGSVAGFLALGGAWPWLLAGFALDLAMVGYLRGPRVGAALYNLAHTTTVPIALGLVALALGHVGLGLAALVWLSHVGLDRLAGYGLKHPDAFGHTHLGG